MSGRYFVHAAVLLLVALAVWTPEDTIAALDGAPYPIACIVELESGFDPYAVGAAGELGAVQLHPQGLLPDFMYGDWTPLPGSLRDPFNPYQAVAYLEAYGQSHGWTFAPWSAWRYC